MHAVQSLWTAATGWDDSAVHDGANLVLAFGASGTLRHGNSWQELARRHPGAILLGCTTGGEIHGCDVLDDTLSATAIRFDHTRITAAGADVAQGSYEASHSIGRELAHPGLKALFVLSDGTRTNGSDLVRGLRDAVGPDVVLCGGLAGDGPNFGTTYVGLNGPPAPGRVAAIGLCGDKLNVGHGISGGWDVFGPERLADGVFAVQPFAQVDELAAVGAEGAVFAREPVAGLLAGRAFDDGHGAAKLVWRTNLLVDHQRTVLAEQRNVVLQDVFGLVEHRVKRRR